MEDQLKTEYQPKSNNLFWILAAVITFNVVGFLAYTVIVNKVEERILQKLQKEYSPSPYGPGFDPDIVNPEGFKTSKTYFEMRTHGDKSVVTTHSSDSMDAGIVETIKESDVWRDNWEKERDF